MQSKNYFLAILGCICFINVLHAPATYRVRLSSSWYPSTSYELRSDLTKYEQIALQKYEAHLNSEKIRALIVPHAGYAYSGAVAAAAYRLIKQNYFNRVIILGPSHHEAFFGVALPDRQYEWYKNVLGHLRLDTQLLDELSTKDLFKQRAYVHEIDHAINVQLPFIQTFCGSNCLLVPLLIGHITLQDAEKIAQILKKYIDDKTLIIISSDFTHYGKRFDYTPFDHDIAQHIFELDSAVVEQIQNKDLFGLNALLEKTHATVCGQNPLKILLALIQNDTFDQVEPYVVAYDISASDQKNPDHSVSYASLVISNETLNHLPYQDQLMGYEKNLLLQIARLRLQTIMFDKKPSNVVVPGLLTNSLRSHRGAFVTLYTFDKDGNHSLRGCIGTMIATKSLYQVVSDMAQSAALHDSRFKPVEKSELPYLQVSISVLTPQVSVDSYRDIQLGKDGVLLENQNYSAVYLPKVAIEQHWNLQQMLASLSKKAGLSADAWKLPSTKFKIFQSIDFAEAIDSFDIIYEGYKK